MKKQEYNETRSDTRLPQLRAGGLGQWRTRSLGHLGRSSELKTLKNAKKVEWGSTNQPTSRPTNQQTDWRTKRGVESCSTLLKIISFRDLNDEIFSHVLVTTTRYVGRLVCWPLLAFLAFLASLRYCSCSNAWVSMFHHCPYPPAHDFSSRVSSLVLSSFGAIGDLSEIVIA